ncbi:hypothetical protein PRZ48_002336 [Zasmidium cellare]|uniref:Uncharacterized protein n=1 Tax=Zasmidium cellare TaxID=395010 RepID=A0ABR0F4G4_ZASCE|nr:hypothetical protein PRZ48_002336 [Zasmidium cellare]
MRSSSLVAAVAGLLVTVNAMSIAPRLDPTPGLCTMGIENAVSDIPGGAKMPDQPVTSAQAYIVGTDGIQTNERSTNNVPGRSSILRENAERCFRPRQLLYPGFDKTVRFNLESGKLGIDAVLNAAVAYTVDSHWAFMIRDPQHLEKAQRSGVRATRALRLAIQRPGRDLANTIAVAVLALKHAEYFMHLHDFSYQSHVVAQSALLKAQWSSGHWDQLQEDILRTVWLEEIEEAVFAGTISELDDPLRHEVRARAVLPENDTLTNMYLYCMEQCVLVPRLVCLVRKCTSEPNEPLIQETMSLAERIYGRDNQVYYEDLLRQNSAVESRCQGSLNPLGRSLVFLSTRIFVLTGVYYMYRNMICGLILRMMDAVTVAGSSFDRATVEHEDVRAAENIVMCVEHAFNCSQGDPPFKAMRLHDPITMAYGAWSRLARRESTASPPERGRGEAMKGVCKAIVARIMDLWHAGPDLLEIFEATADAFEAGPTLPEMSRRGKAWKETLTPRTP